MYSKQLRILGVLLLTVWTSVAQKSVLITNVTIFNGMDNKTSLQNIQLIADPGKNFLLIMKDGVVYKNIIR